MKVNFADKNTSYSWSLKEWDDGYAYAAPVGSYYPNALGLFDMAGNVWEWCNDWYDGNYYGECYQQGIVKYPKGPIESTGVRVLRGGSLGNYVYYLRCSLRYGFRPYDISSFIEFRVVR